MNRSTKNRFKILYIILAVVTVLIVSRLFKIQLINGDEYAEASENRLTSSMSVKAPRGEIFDRYGRPLVTNRIGFSLTFQNEFSDSESLNRTILKVINVSGNEYPFQADIKGVSKVRNKATVTVMKSASDQDTNTIDDPCKIVPHESVKGGFGKQFTYTLEPYSVNVFKLQYK